MPSANLELKQHPNGSDFQFLADYHDPILDPDRKMAWMAVRSATPIQERLYVVVQMPLSVIKEPGNRMRANLFFLGLALSAFASAILIPVWGVILRKVLKE